MKRLFFVSLTLMLLLAACGPNTDTASPSPPTIPTAIATPSPSPTPTTSPSPSSTPVPTGINVLNGLPLEPAYTERRPLAVMFNNLKVALPMSGISQADLIYEVVAEGGITRVVGLYKNPALVPVFGSIRSTRAYYLDIAQGHDAILMHVGGSQEALDLIKSRKLFTLDGRYYEGTMCYRDKARIKTAGLEHSMFAKGTSVEETIATSKSRTTYTADFKSDALRFVAKATPEGGNATKVSVKHSNYKTGIFEYDETDGLYYVSQYGSKMVDGQTGDQVNAKNVLILYTSISQIPGDKAGRMRATMTGTGNGTYICDGKQEAIQWSKKTVADPFVYTQADGKPLQLATGVSYINIVDKSAKVTIE